MKHKWLLSLIVLLVWCGGNAFATGQRDVESEAQLTHVEVGLGNPDPFDIAYFVAVEKEFWLDEGLAVSIRHYPMHALGHDAVMAEDVDFARPADFASLPRLPKSDTFIFAWDETRGPAFASLITLDSIDSFDQIEVGATLGGTYWDYVWQSFIEHEGLEIELRSFSSPADIVAAMSRGDVDASFLWAEPRRQALLLDNTHKLMDNPEYTPLTIVLIASGEILRDRPEVAEAFLRGLQTSYNWIENNLEDAQTIASNYTGIPVDAIANQNAASNFGIRMTEDVVQTVNQMKNWSADQGIMPDYDLHKRITTKIMERVSPETLDYETPSSVGEPLSYSEPLVELD